MDPTAGIIGENATYTGQKTLNGKTYDTWTWKETILGIVVMETSVVYIDLSTSPASPVRYVTTLILLFSDNNRLFGYVNMHAG
jgi:hypothetical protein